MLARVLFDITEAWDRTGRFRSLRQAGVVSQSERGIEVYSRTEEGAWVFCEALEGGSVGLEALGGALEVDRAYRNVELTLPAAGR